MPKQPKPCKFGYSNPVKNPSNPCACALFTGDYVGSQKIEVAKSLLVMPGHELEEIVKDTFQPLKSFKNSGELLNHIVETIIPDHSEIAPMCILSSFRDISESD
jgi:hypothetical protein